MNQAVLPLALAISLFGLPAPVLGSCRHDSIQVQYDSASEVYEAILVLSEYIRDKRGDDLDADAAQALERTDTYRFVLEVRQTYKGSTQALVEKRKRVWGPVIVSGPPTLDFENLQVGTRVLIFEPFVPGSTSGCGASAVVDDDIQRQVLPQLSKLQARGKTGKP